jgi:hypothetical protein
MYGGDIVPPQQSDGSFGHQTPDYLPAGTGEHVEESSGVTEQLERLIRARGAGRADREDEMRAHGYPAYTTSAGWLGYSDDKVRRLCREGVAAGWRFFKVKIGADTRYAFPDGAAWSDARANLAIR